MTSKEFDILESYNQGEVDLINPFPGLRPFTFEESHLFFGREGQSDEVLLNLAQHRFTAVIGASGSGKSSLMYCGLVPILYGGFMTDAGSDWSVIITRPGISPIENLATAILNKDEDYVLSSDDDKLISKRMTSTILRSSSMGLVDAVKPLSNAGSRNIFVLVDQFEELFRFIKTDRSDDTVNIASAYVNLLIKSILQTEVPVYIALTMRSDFIGDCSQFPELTHIINKSHYLIPQMTRDQQRLAIEGPVAVGGGKITKRLVQQVLNDVGNNPDQLPVMQHALMRTWNFWMGNRDQEEPIDLRHYIAIGKINEALSQHANEAYSELSSRDKEICEVLFKALTEKGADNLGIRRAVKLGDVAIISGVEESELIHVIDRFREPGRSLLMPAANVSLHSDSIIEISHESLMRIWQRLKNWVDEEADSAQMYKRLSDAAEMYQIGKTGLWRPPDLQLALNWQIKQKPTRTWAKRYNPYFERAMVFLETSKTAYESEQKSKELLQKRMLQRTKMVAIVLGIAFIIAIIFFVFGWIKKMDADEQRQQAEANRIEAVQNAELAEARRIEAERQTQIALDNKDLAERERLRAELNADSALFQKTIAEHQTQLAIEQRLIALDRERIADSLRIIADEQSLLALDERDKANQLRMISIAQSMAVKSLNINQTDLKALMAYQAYNFNKEYGGSSYDNYIYDGLYYAKRDRIKESQGTDLNRYKGHRDMIRSIVYAPNGKDFYTTGSDGKILKWDNSDYSYKTLYQPANRLIHYDMQVSPDGNWLIVGSDAPYILVINLNTLKTIRIEGHKGPVTRLMFLPNSQYFISYGIQDSTLRINDYVNSSELKKFNNRYTAITLNRDGTTLVAGDEKGRIDVWNTNNMDKLETSKVSEKPIYAIEFSQDNRTIAIGDEDGVVQLGDVIGNDFLLNRSLSSQRSRINKIRFSPDGELLATASLDGTVQMWVLSRLDKMLPVAFKDHQDYVWSIEFNTSSEYLLAGTKDGVLKLWPTKPDLMAEDLCKYLYRNMTRLEWDRYVGDDINYVNTCEKAGVVPTNGN
jgi:WD40 repeat protein/energy-coupling factor transporter ATP-binding protein EcfA2